MRPIFYPKFCDGLHDVADYSIINRQFIDNRQSQTRINRYISI